MNITPKCLLRIKHTYPDLTGKYRNIADNILRSPGEIVKKKVREIARQCNCDDSLIIRFCQKIGYSGYSEMRMSLAVEFMPVDINLTHKGATAEESFEQIRQNFLSNNNKVLHDTVSLLHENEVAAAVKLLVNAEKIYLLGAGASGLVAADAMVKMQRLGFNVIYNHDFSLNRMLVGLVTPKDVVLAISFSGENSEVYETAKAAAEKKVPVISVTNFPNSRLAKIAAIILLSASDEKIVRLGAMTSRIAQHLILDFLVIYLALENMGQSEENVLRTHEMIKK